MRCLLLIAIALIPLNAACQDSDSLPEKKLPEVLIKAFEQNKKMRDVPAAINYIGRSTLDRFTPSSIVQAINSTPGVRMEERSPGSYRFNIRGSSLRSPFGVRNIKVYYNDIPITDPGGTTYINQLGYYNFNSIEVIKGPGSSLYGAGTGGVLLIESLNANEQPNVLTEYALGSYNMHNIYGSISVGSQNTISKIGVQHQESDGYRNHSTLNRDVHSWNGQFRFGYKKALKTTFIYGNLFYETPGALTKSEYDLNPRASRPAAGLSPSAESAHASITQKQFIVGASYEQPLLRNWVNKSVLYGMFTELRNPTLQNYGRSSEPHLGGRTDFKFNQPIMNCMITFDVGAEWQEGYTSVSIYKNVNGNADSLRTFDEINNRSGLIFSQLVFDNLSWTISAGGSFNFLRVRFERFSPAATGRQERKFNKQAAPRVAVMRKFKNWNLYTSIAGGFSPPTTSELLPTGGAVNLDLNAERGTNYDVGAKGTIGNLYFDVNAFIFSLSNTIVLRRTAAGGDFFVNAGKTRQHGIETYVSYPIFQSSAAIEKGLFWLSHTWHDFQYTEFKQVTNDFSGNKLPAEAPHTISTGIDLSTRKGLTGTITYYFSDRIPLNDANSEYADSYHLVGVKLGYQRMLSKKFRFKVVGGVENLFDQKYSLGNDVNGFGGRYYNAAAGRNYYVGVMIQAGLKSQLQ